MIDIEGLYFYRIGSVQKQINESPCWIFVFVILSVLKFWYDFFTIEIDTNCSICESFWVFFCYTNCVTSSIRSTESCVVDICWDIKLIAEITI